LRLISLDFFLEFRVHVKSELAGMAHGIGDGEMVFKTFVYGNLKMKEFL